MIVTHHGGLLDRTKTVDENVHLVFNWYAFNANINILILHTHNNLCSNT